MPDADAFMRTPRDPETGEDFPPDIPTDRPTPARAYCMSLGSKDNFEVDRVLVQHALEAFPECVDVARQNRQYLYRAVRYLARDVGIDQFLDLGSGLPTDNNVHQVAQQFQPQARVVYVDNASRANSTAAPGPTPPPAPPPWRRPGRTTAPRAESTSAPTQAAPGRDGSANSPAEAVAAQMVRTRDDRATTDPVR
ncbi:SAM-dependent methyltransferase [Lipingzhangella sp. LS1_29]|uniref:SAM-dependent methyltransferase n=1 Tax=Lipingzhangella rawalii TaxID=2055835 RepID=A0ABU2H5F8_9ACTN|nr:SAM-dependent methyltransferase [Lipingzhangella rawalii]MDS1270541.1 SAM-dependent methyltransferase [Lipingzhangella rawalii]